MLCQTRAPVFLVLAQFLVQALTPALCPVLALALVVDSAQALSLTMTLAPSTSGLFPAPALALLLARPPAQCPAYVLALHDLTLVRYLNLALSLTLALAPVALVLALSPILALALQALVMASVLWLDLALVQAPSGTCLGLIR